MSRVGREQLKIEAQKEMWARLEKALARKDMLPAEMMDKIEMGRATASEWKLRFSWPTGWTFTLISRVLDVNLHWLITGEGPMERPGERPPAFNEEKRRMAEMIFSEVEEAVKDLRMRISPKENAPRTKGHREEGRKRRSA